MLFPWAVVPSQAIAEPLPEPKPALKEHFVNQSEQVRSAWQGGLTLI
jgi:hypothetical protein